MSPTAKPTGLSAAIRGCSSWQDIQAKWRDFTEKQKGDLFEKLVKAYLQLEPEYASKLKHVWLQRGKLIMPCGGGKSLAGYWFEKDLGDRRIVIAVPSLALTRKAMPPSH